MHATHTAWGRIADAASLEQDERAKWFQEASQDVDCAIRDRDVEWLEGFGLDDEELADLLAGDRLAYDNLVKTRYEQICDYREGY